MHNIQNSNIMICIRAFKSLLFLVSHNNIIKIVALNADIMTIPDHLTNCG